MMRGLWRRYLRATGYVAAPAPIGRYFPIITKA